MSGHAGGRLGQRLRTSLSHTHTHTHTHTHARTPTHTLPAPKARFRSLGLRPGPAFLKLPGDSEGFGEKGYHEEKQSGSLENTAAQLSNAYGRCRTLPVLPGRMNSRPSQAGRGTEVSQVPLTLPCIFLFSLFGSS